MSVVRGDVRTESPKEKPRRLRHVPVLDTGPLDGVSFRGLLEASRSVFEMPSIRGRNLMLFLYFAPEKPAPKLSHSFPLPGLT